MAYCAMAGLLALFCLLAPYARVPLRPVPAFIPFYATLFIFNELIIAVLILAQFWVVRWTWLLVLASGFLFTALMAIPGVLAFPGIFSPTGLLGAGMQSAAWIGAIYHVATPASLIAAVLIKDCRQTTGLVQRAPEEAMALSIAMVVAAVCGLSWVTLAHHDILPQIFANSVQQSQNFVLVWLMVVCCAWLLELSLGTLFCRVPLHPWLV